MKDSFQLQPWWINAVTPLVLIELAEGEQAFLPADRIPVPSLERSHLTLAHRAFRFKKQIVRVWFISPVGQATNDIAYRLRIHLTRLHCLRESLAPVLRMVLNSRLTIDRGTTESHRFQDYLDGALTYLERDKTYGVEQAPMLSAAYAAERLASAQERLDLLTALQAIRPALHRQVARVLAKNETVIPTDPKIRRALTGQQEERLSEALRDAFTLSGLRQLLEFKLQRKLDDIALGSDLKEIVFDLIQTSEREGWTRDLVRAAREQNPGNDRLLAVATELNGASG